MPEHDSLIISYFDEAMILVDNRPKRQSHEPKFATQYPPQTYFIQYLRKILPLNSAIIHFEIVDRRVMLMSESSLKI